MIVSEKWNSKTTIWFPPFYGQCASHRDKGDLKTAHVIGSCPPRLALIVLEAGF